MARRPGSALAPPPRGGGLGPLARASGLALDAYRREHVDNAVRRALADAEASDCVTLARRLAYDAAARRRFRASVANSVTGLFRDPEQFDLLERRLLPELLAGGRALRAWSAGCATGLEVYSLTTVLDRLGALDRAWVLGTDVLDENLELARHARYREVVPSERERARVGWERRDLVRDPVPSGAWHLVLCRNVTIYLSAPARELVQERLAAALAPGGMLLLGRSECVVHPSRLHLEAVAPAAYRRTA